MTDKQPAVDAQPAETHLLPLCAHCRRTLPIRLLRMIGWLDAPFDIPECHRLCSPACLYEYQSREAERRRLMVEE